MKKCVVWHNLNNGSYYHKIVNGHYCKYEKGYCNQYNHVIVDVFDYPNPKYYTKISLIDLAISPIVILLKFIIRLLEKLTSLF